MRAIAIDFCSSHSHSQLIFSREKFASEMLFDGKKYSRTSSPNEILFIAASGREEKSLFLHFMCRTYVSNYLLLRFMWLPENLLRRFLVFFPSFGFPCLVVLVIHAKREMKFGWKFCALLLRFWFLPKQLVFVPLTQGSSSHLFLSFSQVSQKKRGKGMNLMLFFSLILQSPLKTFCVFHLRWDDSKDMREILVEHGCGFDRILSSIWIEWERKTSITLIEFLTRLETKIEKEKSFDGTDLGVTIVVGEVVDGRRLISCWISS